MDISRECREYEAHAKRRRQKAAFPIESRELVLYIRYRGKHQTFIRYLTNLEKHPLHGAEWLQKMNKDPTVKQAVKEHIKLYGINTRDLVDPLIGMKKYKKKDKEVTQPIQTRSVVRLPTLISGQKLGFVMRSKEGAVIPLIHQVASTSSNTSGTNIHSSSSSSNISGTIFNNSNINSSHIDGSSIESFSSSSSNSSSSHSSSRSNSCNGVQVVPQQIITSSSMVSSTSQQSHSSRSSTDFYTPPPHHMIPEAKDKEQVEVVKNTITNYFSVIKPKTNFRPHSNHQSSYGRTVDNSQPIVNRGVSDHNSPAMAHGNSTSLGESSVNHVLMSGHSNNSSDGSSNSSSTQSIEPYCPTTPPPYKRPRVETIYDRTPTPPPIEIKHPVVVIRNFNEPYVLIEKFTKQKRTGLVFKARRSCGPLPPKDSIIPHQPIVRIEPPVEDVESELVRIGLDRRIYFEFLKNWEKDQEEFRSTGVEKVTTELLVCSHVCIDQQEKAD